jgi:phospholipid/cholesterol/gamma-HCH transport system ATP-binding protein
MIEVNNIWKSFGPKPVHRGITFTVHDHETLVILGKSGGGKSVLLKMIIGLVLPDKGVVAVDGRRVNTMVYADLRRLRRGFGFLFQGAALFDSMTVGENISLAIERDKSLSPAEVKDRVSYALNLVGLENVEDVSPASLSGGMKKRAGLARAIALTPRYMLYDEPTTGLDVETADGINILINDLRSKLGVTSIVVTHDIHSAFIIGDRFVVLEQGTVLMTGTQEQIRNSDNEEVRKYINSSLSTKAHNV